MVALRNIESTTHFTIMSNGGILRILSVTNLGQVEAKIQLKLKGTIAVRVHLQILESKWKRDFSRISLSHFSQNFCQMNMCHAYQEMPTTRDDFNSSGGQAPNIADSASSADGAAFTPLTEPEQEAMHVS